MTEPSKAADFLTEKDYEFAKLQFTALRDEILALKERLAKIFLATISAIPAILAAGQKYGVPHIVVAAPMITAACTFYILSEQIGIMRAGKYIQEHLEPRLKTRGFTGWEEYLASEKIHRACDRGLLISYTIIFTIYYIGTTIFAYSTVLEGLSLVYFIAIIIAYAILGFFFMGFTYIFFKQEASFEKDRAKQPS